MAQLSAVVLERDERTVLRALGHLGVLQLTRSRIGPDTAPLPPRDRSQELARCERLRLGVAEVRQELELPNAPREIEQSEMTLQQADERLREIGQQVDELLKRRQRLTRQATDSTATSERVSDYRGLDIPLDRPDLFSFLHFVTGSVAPARFDALQQSIAGNVALLPLPQREDRLPLIAMTTRQGRCALESALHQAGFQAEALPAVEGATADTLSEASQREQKEIAAQLEAVKIELQAFAAKFAHPLNQIESLANLERRLLDAEQHFSRTETAVLLSGWIPAAEVPAVQKCLRQVTDGRCVIETSSPPNLSDEQIPVLVRQPRLLRPFEMLVSAYGLPSYRELEPTLFVALSYVLMFGMMFGDAGHGAVLAVGGLMALIHGRTEKVRDAGVLILFAALSSIVFGIAYGSCFGLETFKEYALWHDPLEGDPIALMYGAIGIGVVMISLGLVLNIINRFRRGDVVGGLLDKFGVMGVLFYWGVLTLIAKYAVIETWGLVRLAIVLFLVVPIVGWTLKEPIEYFAHRRTGRAVEPGNSLFAAITESLVGAFEAVLSYLANTISFVRLAAYAMSHAALLVAAFMMAEEVRHVSVGGGLLSVLVIILGNLVAIVLEGIIASVQALRLEYYEFFGKFFSGRGRPFTPFRLAANGLTWKAARA